MNASIEAQSTIDLHHSCRSLSFFILFVRHWGTALDNLHRGCTGAGQGVAFDCEKSHNISNADRLLQALAPYAAAHAIVFLHSGLWDIARWQWRLNKACSYSVDEVMSCHQSFTRLVEQIKRALPLSQVFWRSLLPASNASKLGCMRLAVQQNAVAQVLGGVAYVDLFLPALALGAADLSFFEPDGFHPTRATGRILAELLWSSAVALLSE